METSPPRSQWQSSVRALFAPAPASRQPVTDPQEIRRKFSFWQRRVLLISIIGYASFYFVRKNLGIAMPVMEESLGISKSQLGMFLTLHGLLYGVSKFANGFLGDRCNARAVMVAGLVITAALNVCFGFSSTVTAFGIIWMLNGWFQGMGFPPCARLMTHWFPPRQLATKMTLWNTSHTIGAGLVVVLCGYLVAINWRLCFFVPAAIAAACALLVALTLPDTPPSVGLPEVEGTETKVTTDDGLRGFKAVLAQKVFGNKYVWIIALANFFVYVVRYAILDWGPTMLSQSKGIKLSHAGWMIATFELCGLAGMLLSGWLTDRVFGGRGARAGMISMGMAGLSILLFWKAAGNSAGLSTVLLGMAGFFIYGPQALTGIIVANLGTKHAAATAVGLTGLFGYASTVLSGWGLGALVEHFGWEAAFRWLALSAAIGCALFAAAWSAPAHGYSEAKAGR